MLAFILGLSRPAKRFVSLVADMGLLSIAFWGAYWVRLDADTPITSTGHWLLLAFLIPLSLMVFIRIGLYRAVLRFVSFRVLWTVGLGVFLSTFFLMTASLYFAVPMPRSIPIIYFAFALILIGGVRLFFRMIYQNTKGDRIPVLIYGAGASGRQLHLAINQGAEYFPVGYVDDDSRLVKSFIQGLEVFAPQRMAELVERHHVKKVLLALPRIKKSERHAILRNLETLSCEVLSIPDMGELINGRAKIDELKEVSVEDLLGRDPVAPVDRLMRANITGKTVLVTGAGGSIGSELCRQIVRLGPKRLLLFDLSEYALYQVDKELRGLAEQRHSLVEIEPVLGSVLSRKHLARLMKQHGVETVYHAAAYKHVPLVESNVVVGVKNNVLGTLRCAEAAIESGVDNFVLISTDKAVRPTNVMGASKRFAELILQALARKQTQTRFVMVRFGNVLGSSGSVVPLFRQQINAGGPVTVTHEEVVRYFMTIPEASQLVLQAGAMGKGGDVFVLDMGKPVRIMELAHRMIRLSGLTVRDNDNPDGDIAIEVIGLRPGEKLYEELWLGERLSGTEHARIMSADEHYLEWPQLSVLLERLESACEDADQDAIMKLFLQSALSFTPSNKAHQVTGQLHTLGA